MQTVTLSETVELLNLYLSIRNPFNETSVCPLSVGEYILIYNKIIAMLRDDFIFIDGYLGAIDCSTYTTTELLSILCVIQKLFAIIDTRNVT